MIIIIIDIKSFNDRNTITTTTRIVVTLLVHQLYWNWVTVRGLILIDGDRTSNFASHVIEIHDIHSYSEVVTFL